MGRRDPQLDTGGQILFAVLVAVVCIIGIPTIVDAVVPMIAQSRADASRVGLACRACGVVEEVQEVMLDAAKQKVSTVSGEAFALFLGLLSGKLDTRPVKIYEVEVRLEDRSVRVIREGRAPAWKPGDRVKVTMGRIKPLS
jgi:hypothetical protein